METRSSNRLRSSQPTNGNGDDRCSVNNFATRRRCRSETVANDDSNILLVDGIYFDNLPGSSNTKRQQHEDQQQERYRQLMQHNVSLAALSSHPLCAMEAVLRNQNSRSVTQQQPNRQLHPIAQQEAVVQHLEMQHQLRLARTSRTVASSETFFNVRNQHQPHQQHGQMNHTQSQYYQLHHSPHQQHTKENLLDAESSRMFEFEQRFRPIEDDIDYTKSFDGSLHGASASTSSQRSNGYDIVTRATARTPSMPSPNDLSTAKRRIRLRSESEPNEYPSRPPPIGQRSADMAQRNRTGVTFSAIGTTNPVTTSKRARDDRNCTTNTQNGHKNHQHNQNHQHSHNASTHRNQLPSVQKSHIYNGHGSKQEPHQQTISLAGLSVTAASAAVLAIDRADVQPTNQILQNSRRSQPLPLSSTTSPKRQPSIVVNPKYTKIVHHHFVRQSSSSRFAIKPLSSLRKLRSRQALAKTKSTAVAAFCASTAIPPAGNTNTPAAKGRSAASATSNGGFGTVVGTNRDNTMVVGRLTTLPEPSAKVTSNNVVLNAERVHQNADDSETNYSSLEDDDDFDDVCDDGDFNESLSDLEANSSQLSGVSSSLLGVRESSVGFVSGNADCVLGRYAESAPLSASLFPNCSPYISFAKHSELGPPMPAAVQKLLKWKLTAITPIVIRKVLINTGFRLLRNVPNTEPSASEPLNSDDDDFVDDVDADDTNDWMGVWGKHMKSPCFKTLRSYQKINHIPGSFQIGRKDRLWRNLESQMMRHGKKEFGFMPRTYILPNDLKQLRVVWPRYSQHNAKWIIKPPASARGTGIRVVNRWTQIPKRKPLIVQRYVDRPLLINGSKFDLRLYVLVTSINPLRVYMHTDGLARFASVKYSEKTDTLHDRYMHLTNYSINKLSANYAKNEDASACKGHKWTVKSLWTHLAAQGVNTVGLWGAMRNLVLRTILAGENPINAMTKGNMCSRYNCYELFGIDVLLDSELKPWLLEVNISPSLHSASPLDLFVKGPLCTALLNTAMFQVPPRLSTTVQQDIMADCGMTPGTLCYDKRLFVTNTTKAERAKHAQFTNSSVRHREQYQHTILKHLTPDDIRTLMIAEDELARCAPLERIFPTPSSHKYLPFMDQPRYYNRLLDAWELRYGGDGQAQRDEGIALLRRHAAGRAHQIVPPQPARKMSKFEKLRLVIQRNQSFVKIS